MDWVKFGFGDDLLDFDLTMPFVVDYSDARITSLSGRELVCQAISRIVDAMPAPYTLMCSGGVDSQAMIAAWQLSGVPFRIVAARYNGGMNDYDLAELRRYTARDGLELEIIDLDIMSFHNGLMSEWAVRYTCHSPHILSHMYIASQITQGTVISSGCMVLDDGIIGGMNYSVFGLERYSRISGQPMVPFFWNHDRDLMPYPSLVASRERPSSFTKDGAAYEDKWRTYQAAGFDVIPQHGKMHGFELIKEKCDGLPVPRKLRLRYSNQDSSRSYDMLYRYSHMDRGVRYSDYCRTIFRLDDLTTSR